MDLTKQADEFFFHIQVEMNKHNINRLAGNLMTHELSVLNTIHCKSGEKGGVYVSEIAKSLDLPMSAVSRILRRLEYELHYIIRQSDPKDRRNTLVSLTEIGEREYHEIFAYAREFVSRIFQCLTEEEQHQYFAMSKKLQIAGEMEFAKLYQQEQTKET